MGQKVSPIGLRIGINKTWESKWYADDKNFAKYLENDNNIRKYLTKRLKDCLVSHFEIERIKGRINVYIFTAAPGMILGQEAKNIKELEKAVNKLIAGKTVNLSVVEVKKPDLDATLVAQKMAKDLEERASFRSVQKMAIRKVLKAGAVGCKTMVSGRLGGADIARSEGYKEGVVSLHTLRQDVDYALAEASTTYGKLGCKVWISKGKVDLNRKSNPDEKGE